MKKLKQSSALLLIVSFLLSIFSFSVSAADKKVNLHIHPLLCDEQQKNENQKLDFDGSKLDNIQGDAVPNAKLKLYRVEPNGNVDIRRAYRFDEFQFKPSSYGKALYVNGELKDFYSKDNNVREIVTDENGDANTTIEEKDFGWYLLVMDSVNGNKVAEPMVFYVNTNNDTRDIYAYPKVVEVKDENPNIRKYIIGQDGKKYVAATAKQGDKIKYRLDVDIPRVKGYFNGIDDFKNALNRRYSVFKVHDRLLRFNQIVNRDDRRQLPIKVNFVKGNGEKEELKVFNGEQGPGNGDLWVDQGNGKDLELDFRNRGIHQPAAFSDRVAELICLNNNDKDAHFEIEFEVRVNDLTEYLEEVPDHEERLHDGSARKLLDYYFLYREGNLSAKGFKIAMNLYSQNKPQNSTRIDNDYIEKFTEVYESYVGNELAINGVDKTYLKKYGGGVKNYLKNLRKTSGKLGDVKNPIKNYQNLLLTDERETAFKNLLKVDNEAYIELKNDVKIYSNRVRTQFGVLWVRKLNEKDDSLKGAKFELLDEKGNKLEERVSNDNGDMYFIVPVGTNVEYNNQSKDAINNLLEQYSKLSTAYKLREIEAPKGYEKLNQIWSVNVGSTFKYMEISNKPGIKMPFAGGIGTILFTVVGILLIGSGVFLYMNSRRKKSAE